MSSTVLKRLFDFDPDPYRPALALIRVPRDPLTTATKPDPKDDFGTGFFVTATGILLTVVHNLTVNGKPSGRLLKWVWVCSYDEGKEDWIHPHRVDIDPALVDRHVDAAVLRVPTSVNAPLHMADDYAIGDSIAVLGFQPQSDRASGYNARYLTCEIPPGWPVAPFDDANDREKTLRLGIVGAQQPLGKGISGAPGLNLNCDGCPAIAIEKGVEPTRQLRAPEVKTTAIHWVRTLLDSLPEARDMTWLLRHERGPEADPLADAPLRPPATESPLPDRPYPLLEPYTHPRTFAGRERELDKLMALVQRPQLVLCLHAPSGAGKSSLLLAGLVPRLREANSPVCFERRPGEPGLAVRLLKDLFDVPDSFDLSDDRPDLFGEFATWIARANRLAGKPPVIILDQADDFLRQPDRRDDALARLGPLMAATARRLPGQRGFPCRWVLCYRHEFHGEIAEWLQDVLLHARRAGRAGLDSLPYELTGPDRLHSWAVPVMGTAAPGQSAFDAARTAFLDAVQRPITLQRPEGGPQYRLRFEDQGAERLADAFARARVKEPNAPLAPELQVVLGHLLERAPSGSDGEVIHVPPDPAVLDTRIADALGVHLRRALEDAFPLARDETAARLGRAKALLALRELVDARGLRRGGRSREELVQAIGAGGDLVVEKLASPGMRLIVPEERGHAWVYVLTHDRLAEVVKAFIDSESARGNLELDARVVELRQFVTQRSDLYLRLQDESALALTREQHDLIEAAKAALFLNESQRAWWDTSREWFDFTERLTRNPTSGFQALVELTQKALVDWSRVERRLRGVAIDPEVFWSGPWTEGGCDEAVDGEQVLQVVERTHRAFLGSTELVRAMSFAVEEVLRRWPAHGARVRALRGRLREGFGGQPGQPALPAQFRGDAWHLPDDETGSLGFVKIPKGRFRMGSDPARDPQAFADEQPAHDVDLPEFYIGRYPVTVAQFRVFVEATGRSAGPGVLDGVPDHPAVYVTWHDALDYCEWLDRELRTSAAAPAWLHTTLEAGARVVLPSEAEWETAARGTDGRIYPWNGPIDPSRANYLIARIGRTTPVGTFPAGASPYGVLDMSGNVWEWTRSLWGRQERTPDFPYPYKPGKARENLAAGRDVFRVVRGGSFVNLRWGVRAASRHWGSPDGRNSIVGFRVVVSPFTSDL